VSTLRKVNLNMNEELKYEAIKKLVDSIGNKKATSVRLSCTERLT